MALAISDSRRQTGAGRLLDGPGAALDARISGDRADAATEAWRLAVRDLAPEAWGDVRTAVRPFPGGLSLAVSAPVDGLYAAMELNERAWALATDDGSDRAEALAEARRAVERLVARDR